MLKNLPRLAGRNPYKAVSKKEKQQREKLELQVKNDVLKISQEAKNLFDDERYSRLAAEFRRTIPTIMRLLVHYDEPDIYTYNAKMRKWQQQLRDMLAIFDTPRGFIDKADRILKEKK